MLSQPAFTSLEANDVSLSTALRTWCDETFFKGMLARLMAL